MIVDFSDGNLTAALERICNHLIDRLFDDNNMLPCERPIFPVFLLVPELAEHRFFTALNQTTHVSKRHPILSDRFGLSKLQLGFGQTLGKVLNMLESIEYDCLENGLYSSCSGGFFSILICICKDDELPVVNTVSPITLQYIFGFFSVFLGLLIVVAAVIHRHSRIIHILLKSLKAERSGQCINNRYILVSRIGNRVLYQSTETLGFFVSLCQSENRIEMPVGIFVLQDIHDLLEISHGYNRQLAVIRNRTITQSQSRK